jgi:hypothetical protein
VDPESEMAIVTLAQVLLQEGRAPEALEYFDRAVELARTEPELVSALSFAEVTHSSYTANVTGHTGTIGCHDKIPSSRTKVIPNDSGSTARRIHGLIPPSPSQPPPSSKVLR